jgi:hypothetical protein
MPIFFYKSMTNDVRCTFCVGDNYTGGLFFSSEQDKWSRQHFIQYLVWFCRERECSGLRGIEVNINLIV